MSGAAPRRRAAPPARPGFQEKPPEGADRSRRRSSGRKRCRARLRRGGGSRLDAPGAGERPARVSPGRSGRRFRLRPRIAARRAPGAGRGVRAGAAEGLARVQSRSRTKSRRAHSDGAAARRGDGDGAVTAALRGHRPRFGDAAKPHGGVTPTPGARHHPLLATTPKPTRGDGAGLGGATAPGTRRSCHRVALATRPWADLRAKIPVLWQPAAL